MGPVKFTEILVWFARQPDSHSTVKQSLICVESFIICCVDKCQLLIHTLARSGVISEVATKFCGLTKCDPPIVGQNCADVSGDCARAVIMADKYR